MATDLPTGTVTFLFTDIEGSSQLWDQHPRLMPAALARHDELLREAIGSSHGTVFSTGGDGAAAVFARAVEAVEAAVAAQTALARESWPEPVEIRVRMAVHTGEAEERGGDFFGPAVNRTARLMGLAEGGQVLVSAATAEVAAGLLPAGVCLLDVGQRELRSLVRSEHVFQLMWPGCTAPSTRLVAGGPGGNLPRGRRELVGRVAEVADVVELLSRFPLVTLTGVGGVGKTSLALSVAHQLSEGLADGVWFCELAAVIDEDRVVSAVAETLGLRPQAGLTQEELLVRALCQQDCLLVLDNCEHVLDAAGALAQAVIERCQGVRVLASSREGLGVPGERIVAVRCLERAAAVELFEMRVADHHGGFAVGDGDRHLVEGLCQRLDGLPLAIELAAARARSMSLADLTSRLGDRFGLLRGQRRATERHKTLRATVAWSYDLLAEDEQRLFDRLSVFAGGFDLVAAEVVCADNELDVGAVDALVASLVDKSMIITGSPGRYVLLETLRQFGEERLALSGDADRSRRAHLAYFAKLSVAAHDGLQGPDEARWWRRLQDDWANIRSAFAYAMDNLDIGAASTISIHLLWAATWHDTSEPFLWVDAVAALPGADAHENWASILAGRAMAAWDRGDLEQGRDLGLRSLAAERRGHPSIDYMAERAVSTAAHFLGEPALARTYFDRIVERARADGHSVVEALHTASRAIPLYADRQYEEALELARRGRRLAERTGNPTAIAYALGVEANSLAGLKDPSALPTAQHGLAIAAGASAIVPMVLCQRTVVPQLMRIERRAEAAELLLWGLQTMRRRSARLWLEQTLIFAALLLARDEATPAATIVFGAVHSASSAGAPEVRRQLALLHDRLLQHRAERSFEELAAIGQDTSLEQAARIAEEALTELISKGS